MASNGAEDLKKRVSQSTLIIRAKSAVFHAASSRGASSPGEKKPPQSSPAPSEPAVRVDEDQLHCASGTPPLRAYNSVPAVSSIANKAQRPWSAGANCVDSLSNGRRQSSVSKNTQQVSADIVANRKPCQLEPIVQSYRPKSNLDSLKLRSGLLGKRAFSSQPVAAYPTCPSPPKASSQTNASPVSKSTMPTNQSSPWTSGKLRDNGKGVTRPTTAKVPSQPRQETDLTKPLSVQSAAYCRGGDGGDGKTPTRFTVPSQDRSQDVALDQIWRLQDRRQFESLVSAEVEGSDRLLGCCTDHRGTPERLEAIRKVSSEVNFTEAVLKLTRGSCHPRNGTVNGHIGTSRASVDLRCVPDPVKTGKAKTPPCSVSHGPAAKPSPPCLTNRDEEQEEEEEASSVSMETSNASGLNITTNGCASVASDAAGAATQARARALPESTEEVVSGPPQQPSIYSVTTQISAIHLTRESSLQALQGGQSPSPPPLEEQQATESEGSGQASVAMLQDGEEEEFPDELEDDCSGEDDDDDDDDDGSDCSSVNDTSSTTSIALPLSIEEPMSPEVEEEREERPALVPSQFPLIPPTLYFSTANERVEMLPPEQRKLLKWKMSTVTPNVVKHTIARSHFKVTKRSHDWLGCWGHHMKSLGFKAIREYQKLNHFPGSFQIGRKDRLWRNLSKMQARFGKREFSFFPRTFVLPQDIKLLRKAWEDAGSRQKWIIKPPASARGIGIQVIHKWTQMPRKRPLLVQKYLHKPYLISGNKFDLRIYVYVSSYDPLRVYIFTDGLVRFASCKYSSSMKSLGNKFMHLTNYSVNKKNSEYQSNSDDKACQGHKWALKALWQYLGSKGVNTSVIWEKIKDIVIKTIIASDPYVNTLVKMHLRSPYSCHELFGFDIMLDENLKPWVLEVNISPSLHSNTQLDVSIKGQMIRDVLNLAGFVLPQRDDMLPSCSSASSSTSSLCGGTRERSKSDLSTDEKVKRAFYLSQRFAEQDVFSSVLEVLTPEDVRVLAETEDELTRKGMFERVFPAPCSARYLRFFEHPRYLNILLNQWEQKYWQNRAKGLSLLGSLCQKGVHLGTSDPTHLWSKSSPVPKFDYCSNPRPEPSRPSVVVSHRRSSQPDEEDCWDREVQSVTSSLPDISLLATPSPSPSPTPSPCLTTDSLQPQDFV